MPARNDATYQAVRRLALRVRRDGLFANAKWSKWIFDFRRAFLDPAGLRVFSARFWDRYESAYPFRVGGMEFGSVPLVMGIMAEGERRGKPTGVFVVRKSRKKSGTGARIEGGLGGPREKIILVDDLVNSGASMYGAWLAVHNEGRKVERMFAFVNFGNPHGKARLAETGAPLDYEYNLADFGLSYFPGDAPEPAVPQVYPQFSLVYSGKGPNVFLVTQKSSPLFEDGAAYVGGEGGELVKIDADTGFLRWSCGPVRTPSKKNILSSPAAVPAGIVFGAYDGNVYRLDRATGKPVWAYQGADWVGSSPAYAPEHGLVYVGLEHAGDAGSCVALDAATGEARWGVELPGFVHSSPAYLPGKGGGVVLCGSNGGVVACMGAADGRVRWRLDVEAEVKASFAFCARRNLAFFGTHAGDLTAVDLKTGKVRWKRNFGGFWIYSTPLVDGNSVFCGGMDKTFRHFDLSGKKIFEYATLGRIFSTPIKAGPYVVFASNDMRIYFYDPKARRMTFQFQHSERITARLRYDAARRVLYAYDFLNRLYKFDLSPFLEPQPRRHG